jgi:hypothetical protein
MVEPETDFFAGSPLVGEEETKLFRRTIINMIMATDNVNHPQVLGDFSNLSDSQTHDIELDNAAHMQVRTNERERERDGERRGASCTCSRTLLCPAMSRKEPYRVMLSSFSFGFI